MKELSPWTLHLDREGYPVMDGGVRANDPEFLKIVFQNLKRHQDDDKFSLSTEMDGKEVLVSSFDDPLIAQEVLVQNNATLWKFLGDLSFEVPFAAIRVDEWQRLHAYVGPYRIPALMSHKAQSAFLLNFENISLLRPKPFRSTQDALNAERWDRPYQVNEMPWDMGTVNPVIAKHSEQMLHKSGRDFLVPGAGTGHEVPFLEAAQKKVVALDFSPTAKESFAKRYPQSSATYVVGDFFTEKLESFDGILELAFFVAIDPSLRRKAVERIHSLLKPKAFWGGCFFTRYSDAGPPFGLSEWELQQHTKDLFDIVEWQRSPHSHPRRKNIELWALFQKK